MSLKSTRIILSYTVSRLMCFRDKGYVGLPSYIADVHAACRPRFLNSLAYTSTFEYTRACCSRVT